MSQWPYLPLYLAPSPSCGDEQQRAAALLHISGQQPQMSEIPDGERVYVSLVKSR